MNISPREKRTAAIGAAIALAILIIFFGGRALISLTRADAEQLAQVTKQLRRSRQTIYDAPMIKASKNSLEVWHDGELKKLFIGTDASDAAAQFQRWITQIANEQKLEMSRTEFLAPTPYQGRYTRLSIRIELYAQLTQISQFISAMSQRDRLVSVDDVQIQSVRSEKSKKVRCVMVASSLKAD